MLTVELGQGQGRERIELWFHRAMEADPNCYNACGSKLDYLAPKWYGSEEEMLQFGRECVSSKNWGGEVPLMLANAHWTIYREYEKSAPEYWLRAGVWKDVRSAFERFFELNPQAVRSRNNYAWYAYQCQQWDELNKQLRLMTYTNYDYFGGKAAFERVAGADREHAR